MNQRTPTPSTRPEPFAILAMPRTGTHYLETLLNEHPAIVSNGELLNEWDAGWPGVDRTAMTDRELLDLAFVGFSKPPGKHEVNRVGCKINEPQFVERPAFFEELAAWPDVKVILLRRRNLLESLRSFSQARESRRWLAPCSDGPAPVPPQVKLSHEDCESYFLSADLFHCRVLTGFPPENVHEMYYEDLCDNPEAALAQVCDFLRIPPHQLSGRPVLQRQETRPLSETVMNYAELREYFQDSPYHAFFE